MERVEREGGEKGGAMERREGGMGRGLEGERAEREGRKEERGRDGERAGGRVGRRERGVNLGF